MRGSDFAGMAVGSSKNPSRTCDLDSAIASRIFNNLAAKSKSHSGIFACFTAKQFQWASEPSGTTDHALASRNPRRFNTL